MGKDVVYDQTTESDLGKKVIFLVKMTAKVAVGLRFVPVTWFPSPSDIWPFLSRADAKLVLNTLPKRFRGVRFDREEVWITEWMHKAHLIHTQHLKKKASNSHSHTAICLKFPGLRVADGQECFKHKNKFQINNFLR